jgi:hypothetical protein
LYGGTAGQIGANTTALSQLDPKFERALINVEKMQEHPDEKNAAK